jgi:hypothetical protein
MWLVWLQDEEQAPKPPPVAKYVVSGGLTGFSVANDIQFIDFDAVDPATPYAESKAIPWNMEINPKVGESQLSAPLRVDATSDGDYMVNSRQPWCSHTRRTASFASLQRPASLLGVGSRATVGLKSISCCPAAAACY